MMHAVSGRFYLGTSGFAYDEWRKGVFYPEDLKKDDMLDYYSTQLSSVEINYTFRRFPSEQTVQKWRAKAAAGFVFTLKASQRITHWKKLKDVGQDVTSFVERGRLLGDRFGCVLFQCPPTLAYDAELLDGFLAAVDAGPVVIVGNSIGGGAAIRWAAAHPGSVRGLVLVNTSGLDLFDRTTRVACGLMARFFRAGVRRAWWYPRAFGAYYRTVLPAPAATEQRARIVASAEEIAPVLAEAWSRFASPDADLRALVPTIACPVLVTWAVGDRFNQLKRARPALQRFPHTRLVEFPGGHAPQLENPEAFEGEMTSFLAGLA